MTEELPASIGDSYETLTTKEGWRAFVDERPEPPTPLEPAAKLDPEELDSYQEARKDYHCNSVIVATPTIRKVVTTGRKRIVLNRHQISARRGLIVSGSSGTGKTTAITQLGKNVEQLARRRNPAATGRLPVVFVTVPPAATPKMLAGEFARFLGILADPRWRALRIHRTSDVAFARHQETIDAIYTEAERRLSIRTLREMPDARHAFRNDPLFRWTDARGRRRFPL